MFLRSRWFVVCAFVAGACETPDTPALGETESQLGTDLKRLRAHNDATNNYYGFNFSAAYAYHRVYIDTDESSSGFSRCGIGANYLVENSRLYQYTGTGTSWSWSQIGTLTPAITATSATWTVPRSSLGETAYPNAARMCFEGETSANVRDTSAVYRHVYTNETLPIHAHAASNDDATIYYQATFDVAVNHKHVFIDVDESTSTGYTAGGIGADFMVENSTLYDYAGTGSDWTWTSIGSANMSPSTQGATGVTTWSISRSAIGETAASERADLVFHGSPAAGGSSTYTAIYEHLYTGGSGGLTADTSYTPDTSATLLNPERGFYFNRLPSTSDYHTVLPAYLYLDDECNDDLVWAGVGSSSTTPVLKTYAQQLETYRANGVKVLFRPRYDTQSGSAPAPECGVFHANTIERQENHIRAVAAMLADYKDVVAFVQAGYLGRWGEWNTNDYADSTAPFLYNYTTRQRVIDYILSQYALKGIKQDVELRRPVFAKEVLVRNASANVGLHSDCILLNDSFGGTFSDFTGSPQNFGSVSAAKAYAQDLTVNASYGGETCNGWGELAGNELWRSCSTMLSESAALHMSYLNGDYATGAVTHWNTNGCLDDLQTKLGYRFEVTKVEYTPNVAAGQSFTVVITVKNVGWTRLHKPRDAKLVLRNATSVVQVHDLAGGDVETWGPGETKTLSVTAAAPSTSAAYSLHLWLPDPDVPATATVAKVKYAVKLATKRGGTNVFNTTTGENTLGVSITVP